MRNIIVPFGNRNIEIHYFDYSPNIELIGGYRDIIFARYSPETIELEEDVKKLFNSVENELIPKMTQIINSNLDFYDKFSIENRFTGESILMTTERKVISMCKYFDIKYID